MSWLKSVISWLVEVEWKHKNTDSQGIFYFFLSCIIYNPLIVKVFLNKHVIQSAK